MLSKRIGNYRHGPDMFLPVSLCVRVSDEQTHHRSGVSMTDDSMLKRLLLFLEIERMKLTSLGFKFQVQLRICVIAMRHVDMNV